MRRLIDKLRRVDNSLSDDTSTFNEAKLKLDLSTVDVVIHIGAPKTGSSAIQNYCQKNSKVLRSHGILYPDHNLDSNGISGGHWELAQHIVNNDLKKAREVFSNYLKAAKARKCTLLLSAESFFVRPKAVMEVVGDTPLHIIGFFRHPLEALQSHYNQGVKRHLSTARIKDVAKSEHALRPGITGKCVLDWINYVEKDVITIIPYSNSQKTSFDTPSQLMSKLGVPYQPTNSRLVNNSYSQSALEFKRLVNSIIDPEAVVMNSKLDQKLQRYSDQIDSGKPSLKDLLGQKIFSELDAKYRLVVREVEECFSINVTYNDSLQKGYNHDSPELVWEYLSSDLDICSYMNRCLYKRLVSGDRSYDLVKLAEWMELEFESLELMGGAANLTGGEVYAAVNPKAELPDVLRELAKLLERLGNTDGALKVATRALHLRPKGPYLKLLVERLSTYSDSASKEL